MKTYTAPQMRIVTCTAEDIVTLSVTENGLGDNYSFDQVMNLN